MFSQGLVGCEGMAEQGQASPREMPSICVRVEGQIGDKPSMMTDQRVGTGMMGTDAA